MALGGPGYGIRVELGLKQVMRDGIKLSADVFRPDAEGRFPTILTRTPYRTAKGFQEVQNAEAELYASRGYAFIIQDCRGKNDSDGVFRPFLGDDSKDGFDSLAWAREQDWCNGSLGMTGGSYAAWNQWGTAALHPPGLKAMICRSNLPDPVLNFPYQNGAFILLSVDFLAHYEGRRNTLLSLFDTRQLVWHLPLKTLDEKFGRKDSRIWQEWIAHPSADGYWKKGFYRNKFRAINLPVLHITGWYDDDIIGTQIAYEGMTDLRRRRSKPQKLVIGPWQHRVNAKRKLGDIDFGDSALIDLDGLKLRWFDRWLKGERNGVEEPPVQIFTLGRNEWRDLDSWPPRNSSAVRYYLSSKGNANTSFGDGLLSVKRPTAKASADAYVYDPEHPVPNIDDPTEVGSEGPFDQRPIEARYDVLVYSSAPLEREVEVSGRVTVKIFATTTARDTDFWAQLTDVYPDGYSLHLTEGIVRGRYHKSLERPELLTPGSINEFTIDMWIVSNSFLKGHRIRLNISSSSFPKYDRNPNTGHPFGQDSELAKASQRVLHDPAHPSHLLLPVVGRQGRVA